MGLSALTSSVKQDLAVLTTSLIESARPVVECISMWNVCMCDFIQDLCLESQIRFEQRELPAKLLDCFFCVIS